MELPDKIPVYLKITIVAVGIVASWYILLEAELIIVPMLYATFFAILLNPAVLFLTGKKLNRVLAISIVMLVALALLSAISYLLISQFQVLSSTFPVFKDKL